MTRFGIGPLLALSVLTGCTTTKDAVRQRFATEHGCAQDEVVVTEQGGSVYAASGCGKRAEYVCAAFAGSEQASRCAERGVNKRDSGMPPPPARPDLVSPK